MLDEPEPFIIHQVLNIFLAATGEIIDTGDMGTGGKEGFTHP